MVILIYILYLFNSSPLLSPKSTRNINLSYRDISDNGEILLNEHPIFYSITDAMAYQMPPTVGVQIGNQIIAAENSLSRSKRSPYSYGYRYSTGRGHGSGYGHGSRYGNCYNCRRPGRVLGTAAVVGGAAFAGGFIGSAVGK